MLPIVKHAEAVLCVSELVLVPYSYFDGARVALAPTGDNSTRTRTLMNRPVPVLVHEFAQEKNATTTTQYDSKTGCATAGSRLWLFSIPSIADDGAAGGIIAYTTYAIIHHPRLEASSTTACM